MFSKNGVSSNLRDDNIIEKAVSSLNINDAFFAASEEQDRA